MKRVLLSMGAIAVAMTASAQITVTSSNLPVVFDASETAADTIVDPNTINPGNSGANQTWDFSSLTADEVNGIGYLDPSSIPGGSDFPDATIATEFGNGTYAFFRTGTDGMYLLGLRGGFDVNFEPESTIVKMPVTYGDAYQDNSALNADFADFTGTHDSLRYSQETSRDVAVDAWGDVTLPNKTYPALRLNIEETNTVRIYGKDSTVLGWGDWTYDPVLTQAFGGGSPVTSNRFQWFTNDASVITTLVDFIYQPDSAEVIPEGVAFAYFDPIGLNELPNAAISLYPNPATDIVNVALTENLNGYVKVYNGMGQLVATQTVASDNFTVDLAALSNGTYFLHVIEMNGTIKSVNQFNVTK